MSGAVSFVDQNIINNRNDIGTSASRLQTGYSQNRGGSLIGLEMHLGEFRTRTLIPGVDSANEVVVSNGGQGLDVAGRIGSYGVQFNVGRDFTQGTGAALRTLIELGVIEVIGKWARVPYWQCLSLDQTHPDFQRSLLDWYTSDSEDQKRSNISNALFASSACLSAAGVSCCMPIPLNVEGSHGAACAGTPNMRANTRNSSQAISRVSR